MVVSFSTRCTLKPESAKSTAALNPAMPPPTTRAVGVTGTVLVGTSSNNLALAIPALISSTAFLKAFSLTSGA
jgi:hypothetical protein